MTNTKEFLFTPSLWLGEGKISFTSSPEFLKFYTKWEIKEKENDILIATQIVEIQGIVEKTFNTYFIEDIQPTSFKVTLENAIVGSITGMGRRDSNVISWEFLNGDILEGFEVYKKQENGDYSFRGEYGREEFKTIIEGIIWLPII